MTAPTTGGGSAARSPSWAKAVGTMAEEISYDNFKNRIAREDPDRARLLARVCDVLYEIQRQDR
jgi:hypothetical protein